VACGDRLERVDDAKSAGIEIGLDPVAARTLREIGLAAVLACQEPLGETEIGDDADLLPLSEVGQAIFKFVAVGEIVFRLQNLVAGKPLGLGRRERSLEQLDAEVRGAAPADLSLFD
jgi:hypothetical protein